MTQTTNEPAHEPTLSAKEKALIAVGAAIASGCRPCLERTLELARHSGACERSIRLAIETALEAHARLLTSLAEYADRLQSGRPELDDAFRRDRARLTELIRCASGLPLRDAEGLDAGLASARAAGSTERMLASALAIARSIAETATSIAEGVICSSVSSAAAEPVPSCCSAEHPQETPQSDGSCCCAPAGAQRQSGCS